MNMVPKEDNMLFSCRYILTDPKHSFHIIGNGSIINSFSPHQLIYFLAQRLLK